MEPVFTILPCHPLTDPYHIRFFYDSLNSSLYGAVETFSLSYALRSQIKNEKGWVLRKGIGMLQTSDCVSSPIFDFLSLSTMNIGVQSRSSKKKNGRPG